MLELRNITKVYQTENFTQKALDDVSVNFRKCEFVSILGQSGSGKTTLLNIIGGLDEYTSGDLIINETSTKMYNDRDWDTYRNHRVGFVFQSYNLISHQSILTNVELALTLSGVSKKERRERATKALEDVGLKDHIHKRPSELSGGQMQRVAIARALVNNPEIILADEPTGALDSQTSLQVMDILKKVSVDRLVIMVTHNPDLANTYSNRIINLMDGKIVGDSNPYDGGENTLLDLELTKLKTKKTKMSFKTSLALSMNNLMTKKGRTILTSFAGSIGIIGIALILSLSTGVNDYINDVQKDTMLSYPITIESKTMDLTNFLKVGKEASEKKKNIDHKKDAAYGDNMIINLASSMTTSVTTNNLKDFKKYLDDKDNPVKDYLGENGIVYSYDTIFNVYDYDVDNTLINTNGSTFTDKYDENSMMGRANTYVESSVSNSIFSELLCDKEGNVSKAIKSEYELVHGNWPKEYNEVLLMLDENNEISTPLLYYLGLLPAKEYKEILNDLENDKDFKIDTKKVEYEDILNKDYYLLTASDYYEKAANGLYKQITNENALKDLIDTKAIKIKIVGIVRQKEKSNNRIILNPVGYTTKLTKWIMNHTDESEIVKKQEEDKETNVLNGLKFSISSDDEKAEEAKKFLQNLGITEKANFAKSMLSSTYGQAVNQMGETELAGMLDGYLQNPDKNALVQIYDTIISSGSYEKNMSSFGKVYEDTPSKISIYTDSFENKSNVTDEIEKYNEKVEEQDKITYTDVVGLLMSSVTTIINAISYVLIAFVSISLVVSSIMIAIITYISVLERTKEIGILRAIGASKKDVTRLFNAETFIEGLVAGAMGIIITILLNIPINIIIYKLTDINGLSKLPIIGGIALILISVILTMIAGLIPSRMAAKKDPVVALRTE